MREPLWNGGSVHSLAVRTGFAFFLSLTLLALPTGALAQQGPADGGQDAEVAAADDADLVDRGKFLWVYKGCEGCHTIGDGRLSGGDLMGVTQRRQSEWLRRFLAETDEMLNSDPLAMRLLEIYNYQRMPEVDLRDDEISALLAYIAQRSEEKQGQTR